MNSQIKGASPARDGIQSIARAISLLECIVENDAGLTLSELSRRTGLNPSTTHRILQTLCDGAMLCRDLDNQRFVPGSLLLRLARSSMVAGELSEVNEIVHALAERTGETASFGVRDGDSILVLVSARSARPLHFDRGSGARLPLHASAFGRAMLAFAAGRLESVVARLEPLQAVTEHTITASAELLRELRATRERGYAVCGEEYEPGVRSVAAPVGSPTVIGQLTARATVGIEGPANRIGASVDELGHAVLDTARALQRLPSSPSADRMALSKSLEAM